MSSEDQLKELNNRAAGEVVIREALKELDIWEVEAKFLFIEHQASSGEMVPLIKDWKDVLNKVGISSHVVCSSAHWSSFKVGDNQVLLQSVKGSPYFKSFGDRAVVWESKLADLDDVLNNLNTAQRKWVYLEPYQEQMKLNPAAQTGVSHIHYSQCSVLMFTFTITPVLRMEQEIHFASQMCLHTLMR